MKTVIEILIDYSSSMQGDRLNICKKMLLEEILPMIDYSSRIGIKTFTATTDKKPSILERQGLKITNKEELEFAISNLDSPDGNTPIAAAIRNSVTSLKEYRAFKKKIILITDGEENCNGDYEAEAKKAKAEGIECEIHVVGLGLDDVAVEKAKRISNASGGTFSNLVTSAFDDYNSGVVQGAIVNLKKSVGRTNPSSNNNSADKKKTSTPPQPAKTIANPTEIAQNPISITSETEPIVQNPEESINSINNKDDIVPDLKENSTDYSKLMSTVESNSSTLKDVVEELKNLTTEIKELKKTGIKNNQEDEIDQIIINEDKELNEQVRAASEKYVFEVLGNKYGERVKWLNEKGESGQDHDFEIIDTDDSIEYFIECKGTKSAKKSFLITKNEWKLFLNQTKNYQIFFVSNALNEPKLIKIDNLLDWILKGKVVPYSKKNIKLKSERVVFTILD